MWVILRDNYAVRFAVTKSEPQQQLSTEWSSLSTKLALSGPRSAALAQAVHGSKTPRKWTEHGPSRGRLEMGRPENWKIQRWAERNLKKRGEASLTISHLASGTGRRQTVHSIKWSFPSQKSLDPEDMPQGLLSLWICPYPKESSSIYF